MYTFIFHWWLLYLVLGIAGLPLTNLIFKKFLDFGYGLSKILSLLVVSYIIFLLSTLKVLPLTQQSMFLVVGLYSLINFFIYFRKKIDLTSFLINKWPIILLEESLFAFGLLLWAYVRAHQPDINGLEKFMDFGFVNSILKSRFLPPPDMWFAGKSINYYWFGHFVTAVVIKMSSVPSGIGYNLMLGTILGLSLSGSFSVVSSLVSNHVKLITTRRAVLAGLVSAILLNFAGNFHTPFYILKNGKAAYWYPDATRFIGYNPDVNDKTIHEFPIYSYVVSDLHAHLLNLPFVILFLALLYVALTKFHGIKNKVLPAIGFTLGVMFMTNAWDFANYLLVTGFVFLFYHLKKSGLKIETVYKTALPIVVIIIVAIGAAIPFIVHFESIAQGVNFTHTKTPLWQLSILWGFPALMSLIYISRLVFSKTKKIEDLFILSLLAASWTLIALPELIYVKDIYAATHYRANTMFKLTYQAYVMFYLSTGYIVIRTVESFKKTYQKIVMSLFYSAVFASILYYPFNSVNSYYDSLRVPRDLSGETWLNDKYPDTFAAVTWFRNNVKDQPTILEAPGDSYTEFNSISAYTGLPTVSGWFVHEWLWRGSPDFPQARVNDITQIYTSSNLEDVKSLLQKYNVKYVVVGDFERQKYPNLDEQNFNSLGRVVFSSQSTRIYLLN